MPPLSLILSKESNYKRIFLKFGKNIREYLSVSEDAVPASEMSDFFIGMVDSEDNF